LVQKFPHRTIEIRDGVVVSDTVNVDAAVAGGQYEAE